MAWSPFQRANAGIILVEQPGDYANPMPTTPATGPREQRLAVVGAEEEEGRSAADGSDRYVELELPRFGGHP